MRPLARTEQPQWRGGLLPAQLGGLLDPAIERIQGAMRPENWNLTQWPSLEQIQALAKSKGPVGWEQMAPLMDAVNPMAKLGGLFAHTVWHGSPHKWDVPDISKVGTGEGAQAYGHGFYSAESEDVGKSYMRAGQGGGLRIDGKSISGITRDDIAGMTPDEIAALAFLRDEASIADAMHNISSGVYGEKSEIAKKLLDSGRISERPEGYLYKLDIPDEDIPKYLDWDKPLSEQAEGVRDAINAALAEVKRNPEQFKGKTGQELLQYLMPSGNKSEASERLNRLGIPGIRYLDGSSRGAGEGTYNYVTFDPSRIKVLERK